MLGTVNNLVYYQTADGTYRVRRKGTLDRDRLLNDPRFERTRETMKEFKKAAQASKFLRISIGELMSRVSDKSVNNRLSAAFKTIIRSDLLNERGERTVSNGDISLLKGFELGGAPITTTFFGKTSPNIDRASGKLSVTIDPYVPKSVLFMPADATHYQFHVAGVEIDFTAMESTYRITSGQKLERTNTLLPETVLEVQLTPNSVKPLILFFIIDFWLQEPNGMFYPLKNNVYNGMTIVDVSKP
jgi:hypothetical protein